MEPSKTVDAFADVIIVAEGRDPARMEAVAEAQTIVLTCSAADAE